MARRTHFASPGDDYLQSLGELVYAVSSLEWLLVGDLGTYRAHLPPTLTVGDLAPLTTHGIGVRLRDGANSIQDLAVREYFHEGGLALIEIAPLRNAAMHARPATINGRQRLHRWVPGEVFDISEDWLEVTLHKIARDTRRLNALRAAARNALNR